MVAFITTPNDHDVLCGRDSSCMIRHPGNQVFRQMIDEHKHTYGDLSKHDKMVTTKEIIEELRSTYGTRFLPKAKPEGKKSKKNKNKEEEEEEKWVEITDHKVRDKVGHALRFAWRSINGGSTSPTSGASTKRRSAASAAKKSSQSRRTSQRIAGVGQPTVHLNSLSAAPNHFAAMITDQLTTIIDEHTSDALAAADGLKVNKTGTSNTLGFSLFKDAAPNLPAFTGSTALLEASLRLSEDNEVDSIFQRQQAIFSSMGSASMNHSKPKVLSNKASTVDDNNRPVSLSPAEEMDLLNDPVIDNPVALGAAV